MQPNKQKQRNYKNMTRERRIEANARERNRVHTISAAFEKLRTSVPAYSHNQKLSKLSVLRIACSYILLLSRLAGHDYSEGGTEPSISECVDLTTRTIQVEGKAKKKRDE
ncbi:Transcription factor atoh8 [Halocaridina rubra]|uniref:Transcription factor atoh8 n=1 Tax=Halocaridina rubra TaxID=373956 RepID=A0AAN8X945_HALRR